MPIMPTGSSVQDMGYQPPLYAREEQQRTSRWGKFSGVNSPGKEPPGLKAVSVRKNSITHYRKSKHGTGKRKSCGFSLEYIRQTPYWWLIKPKTDRRKPHSMSIKKLLEEAVRLLPEHHAQTDKILGQGEKIYNKNGIWDDSNKSSSYASVFLKGTIKYFV